MSDFPTIRVVRKNDSPLMLEPSDYTHVYFEGKHGTIELDRVRAISTNHEVGKPETITVTFIGYLEIEQG